MVSCYSYNKENWVGVRFSITFLTVAVLTPLHYVAYLGEPAVRFHCSAANASDISWRINGRPLGNNIADLNARGISIETDNSLLESNLTISSVVSNNNTHILCVAHHLVEFRYVPTAEATFQVQGQLPSIIILKKVYTIRSFCRYTWEMSWHPNHLTWYLPPDSYMESSTNPQHNCSGARYIWLCCV